MSTIKGFLPSQNGLHYINAWPDAADVKINTAFGLVSVGDAALGLCGGMTFAARDLFEAGCLPPPGQANPQPASPAFKYLVSRLIDSFNLPEGVARFYELMAIPRYDTDFDRFVGQHGSSWQTIKEAVPQIIRCIDTGHPCPIGLIKAQSTDPQKLGENHQVLVYGYEIDDSTTTLAIYDCNYPDQDNITIRFDTSHPEQTTDFIHSREGASIFALCVMEYHPKDPAPLSQETVAQA